MVPDRFRPESGRDGLKVGFSLSFVGRMEGVLVTAPRVGVVP